MTRREIIDAIHMAVLGMHEHRGYDGDCAVCDGLDEASAELQLAEHIIASLKRGECWCDMVGHTPACIEAQRFMENSQ